MNLPGKKKVELAPWRPVAVVQEFLSHATLVAVAWYSGLGYFGVIAVWVTEMALVNFLSWAVYPERGFWRHLRDLVLFFFFIAFLLLFVVVTYGVGHEGTDVRGDPLDIALASLRTMDIDILRWSVAFAVVHLSAMALYARSQPNPKREWARVALMQSAATFIALFCLIFVVAFGSSTVVSVVRVVADIAVDDVMAFLAVAVRFGFALLVSRMPEKDLDDIARQPYNN